MIQLDRISYPVLVLVVSSHFVPLAKGSETPCGGPHEAVFIIDASEAIADAPYFDHQKEALLNCLCRNEPGVPIDGTVALRFIQYAEYAEGMFGGWLVIDSQAAKDELCREDPLGLIYSMEPQIPSTHWLGRNLSTALDFAIDEFDARAALTACPATSRLVTVMSEGSATRPSPPATAEAQACDSAGNLRTMDPPARVCAIDIRDQLPAPDNNCAPDRDFLKGIANTGDSANFLPKQPQGYFSCAGYDTLCRHCSCTMFNRFGSDLNADCLPDVCEPPAPPDIRACCDPVSGSCTHATPEVCSHAGGMTRGEGSLCGICPDGVTRCVLDDECDGHPNSPPFPGDCYMIPECGAGACCDLNTGDCTEVAGIGECDDPHKDFLGYGTTCSPNYCPQPLVTGGDNCRVARDNAPTIQIPDLGDPSVTMILSGSTIAATFDEFAPVCFEGPNDGQPCSSDLDCEPGTCHMPCGAGVFNPDGVVRDLGWWEAFELVGHCDPNGEPCTQDSDCPGGQPGACMSTCAEVRIDLLGTRMDGEPLVPAWSRLYTGCPCASVVDPRPVDIPLGRETTAFAYGEPFCKDGNLWQTYKLKAGTYYYPIRTPAERHSDYYLHITVRACQLCLCCVAKDTEPRAKNHCLVTDELDCTEQGGYWFKGDTDTPCGTDLNCTLGEDTDNPCCWGVCCIYPSTCSAKAGEM